MYACKAVTVVLTGFTGFHYMLLLKVRTKICRISTSNSYET